MSSSPDAAGGRDAAELRLLAQLHESLDAAAGLSAEVRAALERADAAAIEAATARLTSVAEAFKALASAYADARPPGDAERAPSGEVERARRELREAVARLVRQAAVDGGLLERFVRLSQQWLGLLAGESATGYLPSGKQPEAAARGVKLREWV